MIVVPFKEEPEDDEPEPLRLEHIHLPVGILFVGTLISLLLFIAEIIIFRKWMAPRISDKEGEIEDIEATEVESKTLHK